MAAAGSLMVEQMRKSSPDLSGLSLIVGCGASGASAARYIHAHGGRLRVVDSRARPPGLEELKGLGAQLITESLDAKWLEGVARVVLSPGLSVELPLCRAARERGIEVLNDIEIFARSCTAPVVAVTGSNGKSTVVTLLERMLRAAGLEVAAGGNLGTPALDLLEHEAEVYVLEVSSFQMEAAESLAPFAAAVLNISADHLDRHADIEVYAALKAKLLRNADNLVINVDDPRVQAMGVNRTGVLQFSVQRRLEKGYSIIGDVISIDARPILPISELAMPGRHNVANALAALALANTCTDRLQPMLAELRRFSGLPHRCEAIATIDGVRYINDSKATNVGATAAAIAGLPGPIVLIAGGDGKGAEFAELREAVRDKVHTAVLIGESAEEIATVVDAHCKVVHAADMPTAVALARKHASAGDTVLLSPACASFDMFDNYQHRGEVFRDAVRRLAQ